MEKSYVFFFHYNKPASIASKKPQISIHYKKQCLIVNNIVCNVNTYGHLKKIQPKFVMKGKCKSIDIKNGIAYIN